jgi:hypothetical protein
VPKGGCALSKFCSSHSYVVMHTPAQHDIFIQFM